MAEEIGDVPAEEPRHQPLEDRVRRDEEPTEDEEQRQGQRHPAPDRPRRPVPAPVSRQPAPADVDDRQRQRAERREDPDEGGPDEIVQEAGYAHLPRAGAPRRHRQRRRHRQDIQALQGQ